MHQQPKATGPRAQLFSFRNHSRFSLELKLAVSRSGVVVLIASLLGVTVFFFFFNAPRPMWGFVLIGNRFRRFDGLSSPGRIKSIQSSYELNTSNQHSGSVTTEINLNLPWGFVCQHVEKRENLQLKCACSDCVRTAKRPTDRTWCAFGWLAEQLWKVRVVQGKELFEQKMIHGELFEAEKSIGDVTRIKLRNVSIEIEVTRKKEAFVLRSNEARNNKCKSAFRCVSVYLCWRA